jgi:P27 family predicted phage terminase small subunit
MSGATGRGRGRLPKDPAERLKRGVRQDPPPAVLRASEDEADGLPEPPAELRAAGRALWDLVWSEGTWLSSEADRQVVAMLCAAADERALLLEVVATPSGRWVTLDNGRVFAHPAPAQLRQLEAQMTAWLDLCGFTVVGRRRLGFSTPTGPGAARLRAVPGGMVSQRDRLNARLGYDALEALRAELGEPS